jgi:hypothetical protein
MIDISIGSLPKKKNFTASTATSIFLTHFASGEAISQMADEEVQPSFHNRDSPTEFFIRREILSREYQIAVERQKLVRERLAHCFRTEGVNQFVNCKELREQYMNLTNDRFHGMIFPPDAQPVNRIIPGRTME